MMTAFEVNFDGLVGPTHNFGGLSFGNIASMLSKHKPSNPKAAALQGLHKMRFLQSLGVKQALLPPSGSPNIQLLQDLGFLGEERDILKNAFKEAPDIFEACYSSSHMWIANAATVCPSVDSRDNRLHFTISNLQSYLHRAQEATFNYKIFKKIFSDEKYFAVHPPLLSTVPLSDEGAANHIRFSLRHGTEGIQIFVYGREGFFPGTLPPPRFPLRQTRASQEAIARLHRLNIEKTLFVKQNPRVIDAGVFHNDVISTANQNVFFYYEEAFLETGDVIEQIKQRVNFPMSFICVEKADISLVDVVQSYLFNSQMVTLPNGDMMLLAPQESAENKAALQVLTKMKEADNPIKHIEFLDLRQSMQNGGGPACLRLRVVMTEEEFSHCHRGVFLTDELFPKLIDWVEKHYRDRLVKEDLLDPLLIQECHRALDELTKLLQLGSIYPFQTP